jgi:hypothetical protein
VDVERETFSSLVDQLEGTRWREVGRWGAEAEMDEVAVGGTSCMSGWFDLEGGLS